MLMAQTQVRVHEGLWAQAIALLATIDAPFADTVTNSPIVCPPLTLSLTLAWLPRRTRLSSNKES